MRIHFLGCFILPTRMQGAGTLAHAGSTNPPSRSTLRWDSLPAFPTLEIPVHLPQLDLLVRSSGGADITLRA